MTAILGFQEIEGSLREEFDGGEPRFFRTYVGPSENRWDFLAAMFGLFVQSTQLTPPGACIRAMVASYAGYPRPRFKEQTCGTPELQNELVYATTLRPHSYKLKARNRGTHNLGTSETVFGGEMTQSHCGVEITIEYRKAYAEGWPNDIHDSEYSRQVSGSTIGDVPNIAATPNTFYDYEEQHSLAFRKVESSQIRVVEFATGTIDKTGRTDPTVDPDDVKPVTAINVNEFVVRWYNVPMVPRTNIKFLEGRVNEYVWFGYPRGAVLFAGYDIKSQCSIAGTPLYSLEYRFIAKTVPARGEDSGVVLQDPDHVWPHVHDTQAGTYNTLPEARIGVWNRVFWDVPIPERGAGSTDTGQYWWPVEVFKTGDPLVVTDTEEATTVASASGDGDLLFQHGNFLGLFELPVGYCTPCGPGAE